jgi:organic hydroperoxide reductase OsmC/OhrA
MCDRKLNHMSLDRVHKNGKLASFANDAMIRKSLLHTASNPVELFTAAAAACLQRFTCYR